MNLFSSDNTNKPILYDGIKIGKYWYPRGGSHNNRLFMIAEDVDGVFWVCRGWSFKSYSSPVAHKETERTGPYESYEQAYVVLVMSMAVDR